MRSPLETSVEDPAVEAADASRRGGGAVELEDDVDDDDDGSDDNDDADDNDDDAGALPMCDDADLVSVTEDGSCTILRDFPTKEERSEYSSSPSSASPPGIDEDDSEISIGAAEDEDSEKISAFTSVPVPSIFKDVAAELLISSSMSFSATRPVPYAPIVGSIHSSTIVGAATAVGSEAMVEEEGVSTECFTSDTVLIRDSNTATRR